MYNFHVVTSLSSRTDFDHYRFTEIGRNSTSISCDVAVQQYFHVGPNDRSTNNLFDILNQNSGFY